VAKLDNLCAQLEESAANLQTTLNKNNNLLTKNQHLEVEVNNWKNLCVEAKRMGKEVAVKANEEIRAQREPFIYDPLEVTVRGEGRKVVEGPGGNVLD